MFAWLILIISVLDQGWGSAVHVHFCAKNKKKPKSFTLLRREETVLCVCVFCTTWHEELLQNWNSCYNKVLEIYEVLQEGGDCSPPDKSNLKPVKPEDMMVVSQHSISDCTQTVQ